MSDAWYVALDGQQQGPFDENTMRRLQGEGRIDAATLVWKEGMADWMPAGQAGLAQGAPRAAVVSPTGNVSLQGASFGEAVRRFWQGYVVFNGRASRSEYWWSVLFNILVGLGLGIVDAVLFGGSTNDPGLLSGLYSLATILPGLAVSIRRLHDIDKSGWWVLLWLVPVIGWIGLLFLHCQPSTAGPNRFGDTVVR